MPRDGGDGDASEAVTAPEWIDVPGGWFTMGGGPGADENPAHRVFVTRFRLARYPVTRAEYLRFVRETGYQAPSFVDDPEFRHPRAPIVGVSWHDATEYCRFLAGRLDEHVALPTEAQWECAARAGRDGVIYPWGDASPESLPDYERRWKDGPEPVDAYPSLHPWGIHGLGENVHEWCADWYDRGFYSESPSHDPAGPAHGHRRASRGGAWRHAVPVSRCSARSSIPPHLRYGDYGFRVAAT